MNGLQIFAFIVLPISVAILGWLAAFAVVPPKWWSKRGEKTLPEAHRHHR